MKGGEKNELNPVVENCEMDVFENHIRRLGIEFVCTWFGHEKDSEFTQEAIDILTARSNGEDR